MATGIQFIVIVVIYFAAMLIMGFALNKKAKNADEFFVAKNKLSGNVIGFSFAATNISGNSYMGAVGTTSVLGYNFAPGAVGSAMSPWVVHSLVGSRIRRVLDKIRCVTLGDVLGHRFYSKRLNTVASIIMLLIGFPVISVQFQAAATSFEVILGIPYLMGVFIFGGIVLLYTVGGGMFAVAWTDFIQSMLMIVGYIILIPFTINAVGGIGEMHAKFAAANPGGIELWGIQPIIWSVSSFILYAFLQVGGNNTTMARFLMTSDEKEFRKSAFWSSIVSTFMFIGMISIGIAGASMVSDLRSSDMLLPTILVQYFPPLFGGLILAAILGAMMSTVDSLLINGSALTVNNIIGFRDISDEKKSMSTARIATLAIGLVAMVIAIKPPTTIQWMAAMAYNIGSPSLTVPFLAGLWWPRANKQGCWAAMLGGFAVALFWYIISYMEYQSLSTYVFGIWPGIIGTLASLVLMVVVSKLTPPPPQEIADTFFDDIETA